MELVFIVIIKELKKLMRCSGSASFFFSKKNLQTKKMGRREYFKKKFKNNRRDDYVKSVKKNIHKQKTYTQKKIKDFLLTI